VVLEFGFWLGLQPEEFANYRILTPAFLSAKAVANYRILTPRQNSGNRNQETPKTEASETGSWKTAIELGNGGVETRECLEMLNAEIY
jgi:hypothetical protein